MLTNLTMGEIFAKFIFGFIESIILFLAGIGLIRWYARKKRWDSSTKTAFKVSSLLLIINIPFEFFFLYFLGPNLIFEPPRIALEIIIISLVVATYYEKEYRESVLFLIVVQALLYIVLYIFRQLFRVLRTILTTDDERLVGSGQMYYFNILFLIGISIFYLNWGDKIQFIEEKNIILLLTIPPGLFYLTNLYYDQGVDFISNFAMNTVWGVLISLIFCTVIKLIFQSRLSFGEVRDLVILEKGKKLLEVKDLKVYYALLGGMLKRSFGSVKAVDGITFDIKTGETVGLVGESGCGKTTVANALLGIVPKEAGKVIFNGKVIPNEYPKFLRRKIQMVFQDPDASLNPRMKIVDIIAEPLKNLLGITRKDEIRTRVLKLLNEVSLEREHMDRFPHEFSGGQKQRIIIARALASNPELIILDEPTSALDVSVQAQILNLLKKLQKTYGYGFLFITHNLAVVNHIADRVAVMYLGKFVEIGSTEQIFSSPTHPYTQALLASRTEIDPKNKEIKFVIKGEVPSPIAPPPGCTFNPRCISDARTSECMREAPHQIKIEEGHYIWCVNPPVSMQKSISLKQAKSDINILDN
ncbi:MAG: ABC transporter ATP-binding protein [Candidatus Thorarchaeota archaeon]